MGIFRKSDEEILARLENEDVSDVEAFRLWSTLARRNPQEPHFRAQVASGHYHFGRVSEAQKIYQALSQEFPDKQFGYEGMALVSLAQGRIDGAIELAEKAISLGSTYGYLFGNLGIALEKVGRKKEAAEWHLRGFCSEPHAWHSLEAYCRLTDRAFFHPIKDDGLSPEKVALAGFDAEELRNWLDQKECDHTFSNFDTWLDDHQHDRISGYLWAICHGGFCDCEIAYNTGDDH